MATPFEEALTARVGDMIDACTRCGKCYDACPVTDAAGLPLAAKGEDVMSGVIDILRFGTGPDASRIWATACALSGRCIEACPEGVNPRFLLAMARGAMAQAGAAPLARRRAGVENFRKMSQGVNTLSRMQMNDDLLARLGQRTAISRSPAHDNGRRPDFVFYTGCNVLKTPHIALLALDIMEALDITYVVMGGATHCCGVIQGRVADHEAQGSMAFSTIEKLARPNAPVLSWCPSCHVQLSETTLPTYQRATGSRPFEMTPFMLFLRTRLDALRPLLTRRVDMRIAMHWHPGISGVVKATQDILAAIDGLEIVDLGQPAVGLMSNYLNTLPNYKRDLYRQELDAATAAGVDALVAVYHADHRDLCAHERDMPFHSLNVLELVSMAMGIERADTFKPLKMLQDVDRIVAECADLMAAHGLSPDAARNAVQAMLDEQPLPPR